MGCHNTDGHSFIAFVMKCVGLMSNSNLGIWHIVILLLFYRGMMNIIGLGISP
jgi:hypothetical protein